MYGYDFLKFQFTCIATTTKQHHVYMRVHACVKHNVHACACVKTALQKQNGEGHYICTEPCGIAMVLPWYSMWWLQPRLLH